MSRFWGGSESESESESEESQEEGDKIHLTSRFAQKYDSEEEEEVKRVVRSHKDKHLDALGDIVQLIQESIKEDNYTILGNNFTKLNDALVKWKKVAGPEGGIAPKVYYQGLFVIDEKISNLSKEEKSKMDKNNARALTTLTQKFKKNLGPFQKEFEEYKKNPEGGSAENEKDDEKEKSDDEQSDEEESLGRLVSSGSSASSSLKKTDDFEDDDDEPDENDDAPKAAPKQGVNKWLKTSDESEEEKAEEEEAEVTKKKRNRKRGGNKVTPAKEEPPKPVKIEWTLERVDEELKDIISGKLGKKKIDKPTQIIKLIELMANAQSVAQELAIRMHLVTCHFDTTISMKQHMSREVWLSVYEEVATIMRLLDQNKDIELAESLPNSNTDLSPEDPQAARLVAFLQRLTDEIFKAYRSTDPNSIDYLERLGDEELVLELARQMHRYYNRINHKLEISQVALLRMKFLHYRRDDLPPIPSPLLKVSADAQEPVNETRSALLEKLTTIVCSYGNERMKSHAILYVIYHHALEKRFFEARDLLLMSHLQDQVQHTDVDTQILYHRATVQLGLCAFRLGRITDAHNCLSELYQTNRVRELLAQGTTARYGDRNTEQEKIEKQRQMPYHMHLNLELLECVHLISAMLLETPNMAAQGYDSKRKVISKPFRRYMDIFDRQIFGGPPESPRDHVIAAARALRDANVPQAIAYIINLSCWKILPDSEEVKEMLQKNIREVALQTFVLKYSRAFSSVSIEFLSNMSGLPPKSVHSILSRMMINEEIQSCWHQPTNTMVMHHAEPNKMQSLVLQYADKVETFVGENERVFESRTGGFGYDKRSGREGEDDDRRKGVSWGNRDNRRSDGNSASGSSSSGPNRKYRNYTGGGGYGGGSRGGNATGGQSDSYRGNWDGNRGKSNF